MEVSEILQTIASLNERTKQAERAASRCEQELGKARKSLAKSQTDLNHSVQEAELLYEVARKLGVVTDYLLEQQKPLTDQGRNSFETMLNTLIKQAESEEERPSTERRSNSGQQDTAGHPGGVVVFDGNGFPENQSFSAGEQAPLG